MRERESECVYLLEVEGVRRKSQRRDKVEAGEDCQNTKEEEEKQKKDSGQSETVTNYCLQTLHHIRSVTVIERGREGERETCIFVPYFDRSRKGVAMSIAKRM